MKNIIISILVTSTAILFFLLNSSSSVIKEKDNLLVSLNDTISIFKDDNDKYHSKVKIIETFIAEDFIKIHSQDSLITALQKEVKAYKKKLSKGSSITKIVNTTVVKTDIPAIYNPNKDPYIRGNINLDEWVKGYIIADTNNINLDIKIKNSYSVIINEEKKHFFSTPIPYVEVINDNPYSEASLVRTYRVSYPKTKRFSLGLQIGIGINNRAAVDIYLGIGIQYNVFRF